MAGLGVTVAPSSGIPYQDFVQLTREVEDAGFGGVFVSESTNDALMCCYAVAKATKRVQIGTWIVNIFLRDPTLCAISAEMVQDAAGGRFILGLGVSHRPLLESRGIDMGNGRDRLKHDTVRIRKVWSGEATAPGGRKYQLPKHPIPIYYAALAIETARLAGELADGLMLYLCPPERMRRSIDVAREAAVTHGRKASDVVATMGVPVFMHDDMKQAYAAARQGIAFYGALPFYNRLFARSGFEKEAKAAADAIARRDQAALVASITEQMVDAVALVGPASRCLERLSQYRQYGAEVPIIVPNSVNEDYASGVRRVLKAFAKAN
jgi:alkanesulfonate monooxygenase SsuD/methylene tetrahydromethanopterin reductase-like flavin-dependent oxidoreductase (luciferase family)